MLKNRVSDQNQKSNELPLLEHISSRSILNNISNNTMPMAGSLFNNNRNEIKKVGDFCSEYYSCGGNTELSEFESRPSIISLNPSSLNTLIYGVESNRVQTKQTPKQVFNAATFQIKRRKSSAKELHSVSSSSVNRRLSSIIDNDHTVNNHKRSMISRRLSRSLTRNIENINLSKKSNFSRNFINKNATTANSNNTIKRMMSTKNNKSLIASETTNWFYLIAILFIVFIVSILFILVIFLICYNKFNRICYSLN